MKVNAIGKYEMRGIVNEVEATLIRLFGLNLLDARVSRQEALNAYSEFQCPQRAAEALGDRRGLARLAPA